METCTGGGDSAKADNESSRQLLIRNTNVSVTNLGSGQVFPRAAAVSQPLGVQLPVSKKFSVSCRVFYPSNNKKKQEHKKFILRNIDQSDFQSLNYLKRALLCQLGSSIVSSDLCFDVGYMQGQTKVCMHCQADLYEVWSSIAKGNACTLWCDGANQASLKKSMLSSSDSDDEVRNPRKKKKKNLVRWKGKTNELKILFDVYRNSIRIVIQKCSIDFGQKC